MIPEIYTDIGGLAVAVAVHIYQRWRHGPNPADKVPPPRRSDTA
jgi:hypothetical protein